MLPEDEGVTQDTMMLWAASSLTLYRSEVTVPAEKEYDPSAHLSYEDIAVDNKDNPSIIFMHLKKSKTVTFREGVKITIGSSGDDICDSPSGVSGPAGVTLRASLPMAQQYPINQNSIWSGGAGKSKAASRTICRSQLYRGSNNSRH